MSNTDFDQQQQAPPPQRPYFPPQPPSPMQQVAQQAQQPPAKDQDRLPGGGINFTSPANLHATGAPPADPAQEREAQRERDAGQRPAVAPVAMTPPPDKPPPPQAIPGRSPKPPQAYVPSPVRKMEHWGDDYWAMRAIENNPDMAATQFMPTEQEAYGVLRGANKQLAAFAAPAIAGPARIISDLAAIVGPFFDFFSHNAFSEGYRRTALGGTQQELMQTQIKERQMRMHEDEMKAKRERMIDMAEDLRITHDQMLTEYRGVFDGMKPGGWLTQKQGEEEIAALNEKWHHQNLNVVLQNGGLGAVSNALDVEHNKFVHSWAANASLKSADKTRKETEKEQEKAEKQAAIEAPYRKPGAAAPAAGGAQPGGVMGYTPPDQAAGAAPVTPSEAEPESPELAQSRALNEADRRGFDRAAINSLAERMLNGDFKPADEKGNDAVVGLAKQRRDEMEKRLNDIKHDANLKTQDDVLNAIDVVSPQLRDKVNGVLSGSITAPQRGAVGSMKTATSLIYAMAEKAEPRISTILQTRPGTLRYFTSGQGARQIAQLGTAYDHGAALLESIERLPPAWQQIAATHFPGGRAVRDRLFPEASAAIGEIEKNIDVFSSETGAVLAYGQGTGGERKALKEGMDWTTPNRTTAAIKTQLQRLRDREASLGRDFKTGTGMKFDDFRDKFADDISAKEPEAASGLGRLAHDKSKDTDFHDFREYDPGAAK